MKTTLRLSESQTGSADVEPVNQNLGSSVTMESVMEEGSKGVELRETNGRIEKEPLTSTAPRDMRMKVVAVSIAVFVMVLLTFTIVLALYIVNMDSKQPLFARCDVRKDCQPKGESMGFFELQSEGSRTLLRAHLKGIERSETGLHGVHVHEKKDLTGGCATTGLHFRTEGTVHGGPLGTPRHLGDFGNIMVNENSTSETVVLADVRLDSIIGFPIVVHKERDDLGQGGDEGSLTTGNAGGRLGGCLIESQ